MDEFFFTSSYNLRLISDLKFFKDKTYNFQIHQALEGTYSIPEVFFILKMDIPITRYKRMKFFIKLHVAISPKLKKNEFMK